MSSDVLALLQLFGGVLYHDYRSGKFRDWSETGNHGTPSTVYWAGAELGTAGGHIEVSDAVSLQITDSISIIVRMRTLNTTGTIASKFDTSGNQRSYAFGLSTGKLDLIASGNGIEEISAQSTSTVNDGAMRTIGVSYSPSSGKVDFYIDGILDSTATILIIGAALYNCTAGVRIFNTVNGGRGAFTASGIEFVTLFDGFLEETAHSLLYQAFNVNGWNKKPYVVSSFIPFVGATELGLIAGWDTSPINNSLIDQSSNGNDGDLSGKVDEISTAFGPGLWLDGYSGSVDCGNDTSLDATSAITVSCLFKASDLSHSGGGNYPRIIHKSAAYYIQITNSGTLSFFTYGVSDTNTDISGVVIDVWYHLVCTYDSVTGVRRIYLNGVNVAEETGLSGNITTTANNLYLGDDGSGTRHWEGLIVSPRIYNISQDAAWVTAEYESLKFACFQTSYGIRESITAQTSGPVGNSEVVVRTGSFQITRTGTDENHLALECVSSGVSYLSTDLMVQTPQESLRGTLEYWISHAGSSSTDIYLVDTPDLTVANGYLVQISALEALSLRKITAGSLGASIFATASDTIAVDSFTRIRWKIENTGIWTVYINDIQATAVIGTNPVTDTTFIEAKYYVFDFDNGDKLLLTDEYGSRGLVKRLVS